MASKISATEFKRMKFSCLISSPWMSFTRHINHPLVAKIIISRILWKLMYSLLSFSFLQILQLLVCISQIRINSSSKYFSSFRLSFDFFRLLSYFQLLLKDKVHWYSSIVDCFYLFFFFIIAIEKPGSFIKVYWLFLIVVVLFVDWVLSLNSSFFKLNVIHLDNRLPSFHLESLITFYFFFFKLEITFFILCLSCNLILSAFICQLRLSPFLLLNRSTIFVIGFRLTVLKIISNLTRAFVKAFFRRFLR